MPYINEGFAFFGWRILFSDLEVLQNATGLSCLQVRAGGGSASERRYAARIAPLLPGTGGRWAACGSSAANCSAVKRFSGRAA